MQKSHQCDHELICYINIGAVGGRLIATQGTAAGEIDRCPLCTNIGLTHFSANYVGCVYSFIDIKLYYIESLGKYRYTAIFTGTSEAAY